MTTSWNWQYSLFIIYFADPPEIELETDRVHSGDNKEAHLTCLIHGNPTPKVSTHIPTYKIEYVPVVDPELGLLSISFLMISLAKMYSPGYSIYLPPAILFLLFCQGCFSSQEKWKRNHKCPNNMNQWENKPFFFVALQFWPLMEPSSYQIL